MSFTSDLLGSRVIDDSNAGELVTQVIDPSTPFQGGYTERDYTQFAITRPYSGKVYPRSEWADRIREKEELGITLSHLHKEAGIRVLNQGSLPYCWMYGTAGAMQVSYAQQGTFIPQLSATSAAAKGKNYVKEGGWGLEAIKYIQKYGISTLEYWPEAKLSREYDTPEQRGNASLHKLSESSSYEELESQSFDAVVSALLDDWPVTMGLAWWGHLIFGLRPVIIESGSFGVEIMNSWGPGWENRGKTVLREEKAKPHEAIAIKNVLVATA